jgi:hypothetical protein
MKLSELNGYDHLCVMDRKHIQTMIRRKEHLEVRASGYKNSFDDAEISALKFALRYITEARGYTYEKKGR